MLSVMDSREYEKHDRRSDEDGDGFAAEADALEIALDVYLWRFSAARWAAVARILADLEAAIADNERQALESATAELELIAPVRIIMIGEQSTTPPPPEVRDRLNRLVHALGGTPPAKQEDRDDEGGRRGAASGP